jgi:hypothetical protein
MVETTIAVIPQDDDDRMIEVVRIGDSHAEIRTLCWGYGVGWYRQGAVHVDLASVQALVKSLLQSAAPTVHRDRRDQAKAKTAGKLIPLPVGRRHAGVPRRRRRTGT